MELHWYDLALGALAMLLTALIGAVLVGIPRWRCRAPRCPVCKGKIEADLDARYVPMNLVDSRLIGRTVPTHARCDRCGIRFRLVDRATARYDREDQQ